MVTKLLLRTTLLSFFISIFFVASSSFVSADTDTTCAKQLIPVMLSPIDSTVYHVATWLCYQGNLEGKTVQITVHGATYDHNYWNFPFQPSRYSYVQDAIHNGYAVLNIDRIGSGESDHPNDALITLQSNAFVLHQLIQDLRDGVFANTHVAKIEVISHSLGSVIALYEAFSYSDVDGLVFSGFIHTINPQGIALLETNLYPASQDPKFANSNLSVGYQTTRPGTRGQIFYNLLDASPQVIALDEVLKQTDTVEEGVSSVVANDPVLSQSIHVPILLAMGQEDIFYCNAVIGLSCQDSNALLARESLNYSSQACPEAFVLPHSGHDINLHLNSKNWFDAVTDWSNRRVGNATSNPPTQPCQ